MTHPLSLVIQRCGRVCRWVSGLPYPRHAVQKPHWHLCLHLPTWHAAPALWRELHRYVVFPGRRETSMEGRVQSKGGSSQGEWQLAWGLWPLPLSCFVPPFSDEDECQTRSNLCANGHCINTVGSFQCNCDEGFHPSPTLTECHGECNHKHSEQSPGRSEAGMRSETLRRPEGNHCTIPHTNV